MRFVLSFPEEVSLATVTLELAEALFFALCRSPEEFVREPRFAAAIHGYQRGKVSQEKAAHIAGLDRTDFLLALAREKANAFVVDFEDLKQESGRDRTHGRRRSIHPMLITNYLDGPELKSRSES